MQVKEFNEVQLENGKITTKKFIGGKWLRQAKREADVTVDPEDLEKEYKERFTLTLVIDFTGVTGKELLSCAASTTTFNKQFYNNEISDWSKSEAEEECAKDEYVLEVRKMLDQTRSSRKLTFRQKVERMVEKAKKEKSKEEIKKELEELQKLL